MTAFYFDVGGVLIPDHFAPDKALDVFAELGKRYGFGASCARGVHKATAVSPNKWDSRGSWFSGTLLTHTGLLVEGTKSCVNKNGNFGRRSGERASKNIVYCLGKYRVFSKPILVVCHMITRQPMKILAVHTELV